MTTNASQRISVLLPTRNSGRWLGDALLGLDSQIQRADEVIVIDDGSTDETLRVLANADLKGLRVVHGPQRGLAAALAVGVAEATCPLIVRQDADDVSERTRFALQSDFLSKNRDVVAVGSAAVAIGSDGAVKGKIRVRSAPSDLRFEACLWNPLLHPTVMMRRDAVLEAGNYQSPTPGPYPEDYDLWVRLLQVGELAALPDATVRYRAGNESSLTHSFGNHIKSSAAVIGQRAAMNLLGRPLSENEDRLRRMFLSRTEKIGLNDLIQVERLLFQLRRAAGTSRLRLGTFAGTYLRPLRWCLFPPRSDEWAPEVTDDGD